MKIPNSIFCYNTIEGQGWFRIFGYGLRWKHESKDLLFSERHGYTKVYKVGSYYIGFLKRKTL